MDSLKDLKSFLQALPKLNDKDRESRVKRAKQDFYSFITTYLGHHIGLEYGMTKKESSKFRAWVYTELPKIIANKVTPTNKMVVKAYRGAAKTTLISRLFCLWQILRGDKRYAIIISSTLDLAKEGIDLLKIELEENINLVQDFMIKKGSLWNNEELVFSVEKERESQVNTHESDNTEVLQDKSKSALKIATGKVSQLCKIKSFGAGKKIRGTNFLSMRPDLIICDDIENDENIESKSQRDKLYKWFNKAILKLPSRLNPYYHIMLVGTTLHYDSLLQRIALRKDFKTFSFPLLPQMPSNLDLLTKESLATFKPRGYILDDSSLNIKEILSDYLEDKASFYSEYQNEPLDKENAPLSKYTTYTTLPKDIDSCFIGIDPSLGKKRGDYFALSTLFYARKESKIYASAKGYKIAPDKMIDKILSLFTKTRKLTENITIACEEVAFQEFFKNELKKKFLGSGIYIPIIGIKSNTNKEIRLDSLAPLLSEGDLLIYENDNLLKEELDTYPKGAHDDLIDSIDIARRAMIASSCVNYKEALKATRDYKDKFNSLKEL